MHDSNPWQLDPSVVYLNHGSYGSCPVRVTERQQEIQRELEREPMELLSRRLEERLDAVRADLGRFLGADPEDLVFVRNATEGINAVLRSRGFKTGDELLTTDHEYNASRNILEFAAAVRGATVRVAEVPFPLRSPGEVTKAIFARVTPRTRLLLVDHVTSPTGLVWPIEEIVEVCSGRGIDVLVDGAHAPGMLPLDLRRLHAPFYTGNCHKWMCAPKGTAFLHVRRDRQDEVRPVSISHGANSPRTDRSRFRIEFDWTGTFDPSAWLTLPEAIRFMDGAVSGGWKEVMRRNRELALAGRDSVCRALGIEPPAPDSMIGSMASLPLPARKGELEGPLFIDPLQAALLERYAIEVPVFTWPAHPGRVIRISAQLYNSLPQYELLGKALVTLLAEGL